VLAGASPKNQAAPTYRVFPR